MDKLAEAWIKQLDAADKKEKSWRAVSKKIIDRYRGDDTYNDKGEFQKETFNVLWSNTETLRPAIYNKTPTADIRRRYGDKDPTAKAISDLLKKSISYVMDAYDFDSVMIAAVHDSLLTGRGITRIRYVPVIEKKEAAKKETDDEQEIDLTEQGEQEEVVYEKVCFEIVSYDDFRVEPVKRWQDVNWIAFRAFLTKSEMKEKFGASADKIKYDAQIDEKDEDEDSKTDENNRCTVWEIWDKRKREVIYIAPNAQDKLLKTEPDPLELLDFWPIPRPLYQIEDNNTLVPTPDFTLYQSLANDLDRVTKRIISLTNSLKVRGIYDAGLPEIGQLMSSGDNTLIPATNAARLIEERGIGNAIWFAPLEANVVTLSKLYEHRGLILQAIYELTGISDIIRGSTVASETATAQNLKSQWGSLRLQRRQREVQRYCRDVIRICAEVISEKFDPKTLSIMTGMHFPSEQEQKQAYQQALMMQQQQQPVPQELQDILSIPSWEDITGLMRSELQLSYRIDVETDSTIAPDEAAEKAAIGEMMTGISGFVAQIMPAVQTGFLPAEVAKELLLSVVRKFKMGGMIENALEKVKMPEPEQKQDNSAQLQQKQQVEQAKIEHEKQLKDAELQYKQQLDQMKMQHEQQLKQAELVNSQQLLQAKNEHEQALKVADIGLNQKNEGTKNAIAQQQILADLEKAKMQSDVEHQKLINDRLKIQADLDIATARQNTVGL